MIGFDQQSVVAATRFTRAHGLTSSALIVQTIAHPVPVYVVASLGALYAWLGKNMATRPLWAFVTMMFAWGIGEIAKLVADRLRPSRVAVGPPGGLLLSSGHALNITVAISVTLFLFWPVISPAVRRAATAGAVVIVAIVGLDRIFLGVHFPSDVLAGYILGIGITFSSWIAFVQPAAETSSSGSSSPRSCSGPSSSASASP